MALCILLSGCAQTGPPLPPSLELPKPPTDLRASRKGNRVTLTWSVPIRTTDRQSVRSLGVTRICRTLVAEMKECGDPVAELPGPPRSATPPSSTTPPTQTYVDTLPETIQQQSPTDEVTYAVEVLNRDNRGAGLSNTERVPSVPTLPPPSDFSAQLTYDGVRLKWTGIPPEPEMSKLSHLYRIYRREADGHKDAIVDDVKPGTNELLDRSIVWEKTYFYRATIVSRVSQGIHACPPSEAPRDPGFYDCVSMFAVEGDDTTEIKVVAHDIFPPAVPVGLQAVYSGEGQKPFVDLIWAPVTDADLAGYNVYRREADSTFVQLNSELVKSPSYRDNAITGGKTYTYSVTSVDVRGNESARSEEASETVP